MHLLSANMLCRSQVNLTKSNKPYEVTPSCHFLSVTMYLCSGQSISTHHISGRAIPGVQMRKQPCQTKLRQRCRTAACEQSRPASPSPACERKWDKVSGEGLDLLQNTTGLLINWNFDVSDSKCISVTTQKAWGNLACAGQECWGNMGKPMLALCTAI